MASEVEAGSAAATDPEPGEGYGSFMYIISIVRKRTHSVLIIWQIQTTDTLFINPESFLQTG